MDSLFLNVFLLALFVFLCKFTVFGFYIRICYYVLSIVIGGTIGAIASIPYGKTTNNHFRMFKIFQFICWPLGVKFELRNSKILKSDEPYIVIANHQSALDVLGMSYAWPVNCVVMLKASLKYLPGFNLCAFLCDSIFINRFSKEKAYKTVDETLTEIVAKKRKVWIYPEGTRNSEPQLLPFKKGAFILAKKANIPILPIVFSDHKLVYNFAEKRLDPGHILIDVLPLIDSSKFATVDELADHCRDIIQRHREMLDKEATQLNA